MKNIKYKLNLLKPIFKTSKSKIVFLGIILLNIYAISNMDFRMGYYEAVVDSISMQSYVSFLLLLVFLNTYNTYIQFEKNLPYIMRFETKEKYYRELLKLIIIMNTIIILSSFILSLIGIRLLNNYMININYYYYDIPMYVYMIFNFIKIFILIQLINFIGLFIYMITGKFIGIVVTTFIALIPLIWDYKIHSINQFKDIYWFWGYYLLFLQYNNFIFEVSVTISFILLLFLICVGLFNVLISKNRQVGI